MKQMLQIQHKAEVLQPGTSWLNQIILIPVTIQGITYTFGEYYVGTSGIPIINGGILATVQSNYRNFDLHEYKSDSHYNKSRTIFENMSGDTISVVASFTQTLTHQVQE